MEVLFSYLLLRTSEIWQPAFGKHKSSRLHLFAKFLHEILATAESTKADSKRAHFLATSTSTYAKKFKAAAKQDHHGVNFVADLNMEISSFSPLPRPRRSGTDETRSAQDPLPATVH